MTRALLAGAALLLAACSVQARHAAPLTPEAGRAAAEAMLNHGAQAWNSGNLDEFMSDYTADATFVTPRGVIHGRDAIRARYEPRFRPGVERGVLHFEDLEVDVLDAETINMIAYYVLQRGDSVIARGPTSLVLKKVQGRWLMAHDHSS